jgi:hypothetical protein
MTAIRKRAKRAIIVSQRMRHITRRAWVLRETKTVSLRIDKLKVRRKKSSCARLDSRGRLSPHLERLLRMTMGWGGNWT